MKDLKSIQFKRYETNDYKIYDQLNSTLLVVSNTSIKHKMNEEDVEVTHTTPITVNAISTGAIPILRKVEGLLRKDELPAKNKPNFEKCVFEEKNIFLHRRGPIIPPLKTLANAVYFTDELKTLLMNKEYLRATHSYAWPHVMRGNSLIYIDDRTNRYYAYLPSICAKVQVSLMIPSGDTSVAGFA